MFGRQSFYTLYLWATASFLLLFFSFFYATIGYTQIAAHLKKVRYTVKRPEFVFFNDDFSQLQQVDNWINNFIWVKSKHWEYEQEWRILDTLNNSHKLIEKPGAPIHLFLFPLDSIKNIFLGCKMSRDNIMNFLHLFKTQKYLNHVNVFQAYQDEKEYRLKFKKIDFEDRQ